MPIVNIRGGAVPVARAARTSSTSRAASRTGRTEGSRTVSARQSCANYRNPLAHRRRVSTRNAHARVGALTNLLAPQRTTTASSANSPLPQVAPGATVECLPAGASHQCPGTAERACADLADPRLTHSRENLRLTESEEVVWEQGERSPISNSISGGAIGSTFISTWAAQERGASTGSNGDWECDAEANRLGTATAVAALPELPSAASSFLRAQVQAAETMPTGCCRNA